MARQIAQGEQVYKILLDLKPQPCRPIIMGRQQVVEPFTKFGDYLFITYDGQKDAVYYKDNALWAEPENTFFIGLNLDVMVKGGLTAGWVLPVYKCMVYFALAATPGGKWAGRAVHLASLAMFWNNHKDEINQALESTKVLIKAFQQANAKCPKLTAFMLLVTLEEKATQISSDIRTKGLGKFVYDNLDTQTYAEDIFRFLGSLLKFAIGGGPGKIAGWLTKKGLVNLAKAVEVLTKTYKAIKLAKTARTLATGPGIDKPHLIATNLVAEFAKAGVTISQAQLEPVIREGCLADPTKLQQLETFKIHADKINDIITRLTAKAEHELFL